MISKTGNGFDVILITAEYYDDHPMSPAGVIARVLEAKGFSVGILEKPIEKKDFLRLGKPKYAFCVTSGSIDSMLNNYTPLKKPRDLDKFSNAMKMPDRAVIFYCNKLKENFKGIKIIIGGVEASLRRFSHYDYWDNNIRRSILLDTRADILVYGSGEKQIIEIMEKLKKNEELKGIEGTCILTREIDSSFTLLPSYQKSKEDKREFCRMQTLLTNSKNLAQEYTNNYVVQYKFPKYTTEDLDWIYSLPYTRKLHPESLLKMGQFSVVTHRGCIGKCSFCSIALHQGDKIVSRSEQNIIDEITNIAKHPEFKGYIDDLGGPAANMYGMDCKIRCDRNCIECNKIDLSHSRITNLMKKTNKIKGVKKVFVRSGIRYDLALKSKEYVKELSDNHVSGCLKIAPEHFSEKVAKLMNKDNRRFDEFVKLFLELNKEKKQSLRYYLMIAHPGEDEGEFKRLLSKVSKLRNIEQFQIFTPTPMTLSTCMYWTGLDPYTLQPIDVVRDYGTKKSRKRQMIWLFEENSSQKR